jgi:hypothetical protein
MERIWMGASIVCLIVAAVLLVREFREAAFVLATLGVVAWFLSYRVRLRSAIDPRETEHDEALEDEAGDDK